MKYDSRGPILIFETKVLVLFGKLLNSDTFYSPKNGLFKNLELLLFAGTFLFNFNFSELFIPSF